MILPMETTRLGQAHYPHAEALASAVAETLGRATDAALAKSGRAVLVLAGGSTPMAAYRLFAAQPRDWQRVIALPSDERWVDAEHPARNDRAIAEVMQEASGLQILPLVGSKAAATPGTDVAERSLSGLRKPFDCVLLGMGLDSHTASIFPGGQGVREAWDGAAAHVVTPHPLPPEAPFARITLGRRRLLHCSALHVMISGEAKLRVLEEARQGGAVIERPISGFFNAGPFTTVHWSP